MFSSLTSAFFNHKLVVTSLAIGTGLSIWAICAALDSNMLEELWLNFYVEGVGIAAGFAVVYGVIEFQQRRRQRIANRGLLDRLGKLRNIAANTVAVVNTQPILVAGYKTNKHYLSANDVHKNYLTFCKILGIRDETGSESVWRNEVLGKIPRSFAQTKWFFEEMERLRNRSERTLFLYSHRLSDYPDILVALDEFESAFEHVNRLWSNYLKTYPDRGDRVPWGAVQNLVALSKISIRITAAITYEIDDWTSAIERTDFEPDDFKRPTLFVWNPNDTDPKLLLS